MEVSLDGGVTWIDAPEGVRVSVSQEMYCEDDGQSITFNFTHEGLITDIWAPPPTEECLGTSSNEYTEIAHDLLAQRWLP